MYKETALTDRVLDKLDRNEVLAGVTLLGLMLVTALAIATPSIVWFNTAAPQEISTYVELPGDRLMAELEDGSSQAVHAAQVNFERDERGELEARSSFSLWPDTAGSGGVCDLSHSDIYDTSRSGPLWFRGGLLSGAPRPG